MTNLPLVAYVLLTLYVVLVFSSNFSFHLRAASLLFIFRRKITSKLSSPGPDFILLYWGVFSAEIKNYAFV